MYKATAMDTVMLSQTRGSGEGGKVEEKTGR